MSPQQETQELRERLRRLSDEVDLALIERYVLRPLPGPQLSPYRRMRVALGRILRRWGLRRPPPLEPWLAGLEHVDLGNDGGMPLVIWALGSDRETLRAACHGFRDLLPALPGYAVILITDVADFAFFSRLGWLVEFVPALAAPASEYAERKLRYLAWRYRDAPVLPLRIGLNKSVRLGELLNA